MKKILGKIENKMDELLAANGINKSVLLHGGNVIYANGNDGTDFDWMANNRLCEFETYYNDEDQYGACKILVQKDGGIYCVTWGDNGHAPAVVHEEDNFIDSDTALRLAAFMYAIADTEDKYDLPLSQLDINRRMNNDMLTDFELLVADREEDNEDDEDC